MQPGGMAPTGPPPKTNGMAIASLVCAVLPLILFPIGNNFFGGSRIVESLSILALPGPVLGIVFGIVALGQIKREPWRYSGRGLAIAGLVLGIVEIAMVVVAILVVMIIIAACANACGDSARFAPAFLVTLGARHGSPEERRASLRRVLSHHPACSHFAADTVQVRGHAVCRGCLTMGAALLATTTLLTFVPLGLEWSTLVILGAVLGSVQLLSTAGFAKTAATKTFVKTFLGIGVGAIVQGVLASPLSPTLKLALFVAGWLLGSVLLVPRARRLSRHACATLA